MTELKIASRTKYWLVSFAYSAKVRQGFSMLGHGTLVFDLIYLILAASKTRNVDTLNIFAIYSVATRCVSIMSYSCKCNGYNHALYIKVLCNGCMHVRMH